VVRAPAQQACVAPRPSQWAAIRDTLWPLIAHRDGDSAWAHLEPAGLPGQSAAWCDPLLADPSARSAGPALYAQYCASCHGDAGHGDGPGAAASDPPPYDFTRPVFAGMREPPGPAVLFAILTRGIDRTTMRGYAETLSGWERLAVIAYILELPGRAAVENSRLWADSLRNRRQVGGRQ
jgi:high-affinity iron transporter